MDLALDKIRTDGGTQPRASAPICYACGFGFSPILHEHHIRQRCEGGTNEDENLIHLCPNCHALVHHLYRLGTAKDVGDVAFQMRNYMILTNWIREHLGELVLGRLIDIHTKRSELKNQRWGH